MKKVVTLVIIGFLSLAITITSCKKSSPEVNSLQASMAGINYTFSKGMSMDVYTNPPFNFSELSGTDSIHSKTSLTIYIAGTTPGTYTLGPSSSSYISIGAQGQVIGATNVSGGSGTINVTQLDTASKWASGNFNATITNNGSGATPIQGSFTINFTLN